MKTILTIGYRTFLLPAKANVNSILASLSGARELEIKHITGKYRYLVQSEIEMKIEVVGDDQVLTTKDLKRLPQLASKDCNGSDITKAD